MAKINHNDIFDSIDKVIENAKKQNAIHLYAEDEYFDGSSVIVKGKKLGHFATTGYLGLEQDIRLKQAAVNAIYRYGTQFPLSKTYLSHPLYLELEGKMQRIFNQSVIIAKNSTLAHLSVIPQAIGDADVVILDHQVHWSVQNACNNLKTRGIPIYMIRHNNTTQLEDYLKKLGNKYRKIWYMADGIYSMYGDHAPIAELKELLKKYAQLHVYFDDVHGMSWIGTNGSGFIKSHWSELPYNMILISTLSKTFGASGATISCGNAQLQQQIKNYGGALTFSAQLEPASVAAAIASADIHLSDEIYSYQKRLQNKIALFDKLLKNTDLPVVSIGKTPVFYIGMGTPETTYNMVARLQDEGFFVNPGIFPAVPLKNAGLRITISNHNDDVQITNLANALKYHVPIAFNETGNSTNKVSKSFGLPILNDKKKEVGSSGKFVYKSIKELSKQQWNECLGKYQALDYDGMCFVEAYFSNLPKENVNHMKFNYYVITDTEGNVKALTHTSLALWKEDLLEPIEVSEKIEALRCNDPLFLTAYALSSGSTFTEGRHMYVDKDMKEEHCYLFVLLDLLEEVLYTCKARKLVLRDFKKDDVLSAWMLNKGYVIVEMPETAVFSDFNWKDENDFEKILSKRSKRHFKKEVLPFTQCYEMEVKQTLKEEELQTVYSLYLKVKNNNKAINNFTYEMSLFQTMNDSTLWEFLLLKDKKNKTILGVMCCFLNKTNNSYNPMLIGMEETENRLQLYRQLLFKTLLNAKNNGYVRCFLGLSAVFEKRKLGAEIIKKEAYVQMKENFDFDRLMSFK